MLDKMIVLIGMPGCGKTTIGRILAQELEVPFIDTDNLIREEEGMPLEKIQQEKGMEYFLSAEEKALLSLDNTPKVVATGGSAVFCQYGMMYLNSVATVIYLETDLPMLRRRMGDPKKRGVVLAPNQTIASVYRERKPLYMRYADIRIRTFHTTPKVVARRILAVLNGDPEEEEQERPLIRKDGNDHAENNQEDGK
ncbi:MAG: AAA family ATPase [Clostridiales bacterium]|nr:AAA family ATPase [Clostridiales bacterium]